MDKNRLLYAKSSTKVGFCLVNDLKFIEIIFQIILFLSFSILNQAIINASILL